MQSSEWGEASGSVSGSLIARGTELPAMRVRRTCPQKDFWGWDGKAIWAKYSILPKTHTDRKTHFPLSENFSFQGEKSKKAHLHSEMQIAIKCDVFRRDK